MMNIGRFGRLCTRQHARFTATAAAGISMTQPTAAAKSCHTTAQRLLARRDLCGGGGTQLLCAYLSTKSDTHCTNKTDNKSSASSSASAASEDLFAETAKLGLFARFKVMYKNYWYVLIPVHAVTSVGWFGCFYYMSKSGVDIASLLEYLPVQESLIEKARNSNMGHYAVSYLCYKIATPLRYAVTLGGTTVSIKRLVQAGLIKPMPTKQQLIKMYEDKKAVAVRSTSSKISADSAREKRSD